ncbi:imidazole glycerol phosphate synthase subunit HisH [bacterium]
MIAIIDYGMGNLNSVRKALINACEQARLNERVVVTRSHGIVRNARAVVLPGVGAFKDAMNNLEKEKMISVILEVIQKKVPFLGICLGYQLMFDKSYEHGQYKGLGIIKGGVKKFKLPKKYKIPHMGWNSVSAKNCPLLKNIPYNSYFYFVHSYYAEVKDRNTNIIKTKYYKQFASGIWKDNIFGLQFHPEKSQMFGLRILKNFCLEVLKCK